MDCLRTSELLSPLIDGELPLDLVRPLLAHLEGCPACRADADELRSLGSVVREMKERAPVGLGARILSDARAARERPRPLVLGIAAAGPRVAAMLVGAASMLLFFPPVTPAPSPSPGESRSGFHLLVTESQADLELAGSFGEEFRILAARPEGRLMYDLTGGR